MLLRELEELRLDPVLAKAKKGFEKTDEPTREFASFNYKTLDSWSRKRRVIGKAEVLKRGENPRFVVTSLAESDFGARHIYEELYCARGDAENRIREQLELFADQMSTHWTRQCDWNMKNEFTICCKFCANPPDCVTTRHGLTSILVTRISGGLC